MTTSEKVARMAERYGFEIAYDRASFLADQFSRLAGINGDRTLELIGDLMRAEVITADDGTALTLAHVREIADD